MRCAVCNGKLPKGGKRLCPACLARLGTAPTESTLDVPPPPEPSPEPPSAPTEAMRFNQGPSDPTPPMVPHVMAPPDDSSPSEVVFPGDTALPTPTAPPARIAPMRAVAVIFAALVLAALSLLSYAKPWQPRHLAPLTVTPVTFEAPPDGDDASPTLSDGLRGHLRVEDKAQKLHK